jgi:hypothetical protein
MATLGVLAEPDQRPGLRPIAAEDDACATWENPQATWAGCVRRCPARRNRKRPLAPRGGASPWPATPHWGIGMDAATWWSVSEVFDA